MMPTEIREWPTEVVLSLTTGHLICDFASMQELTEYVAGHPVWTHELADRLFLDRLCEDVLEQVPQLRTADPDGMDRTNWQEYRDRWLAEFGTTLTLRKGSLVRSENPIESMKRLAPHAQIIGVTDVD